MQCSFKKSGLVLALLVLSQAGGIVANADEESDWLNELKSATPDPVRAKKVSDEFGIDDNDETLNQYGTLSKRNPISLRSHAAAHLKDGHIDTAMKLAEQAIELEPDNTNGRQIYADALELKLKQQPVRNYHLYNLCVKQWYYLFKHSEYPDLAKTAAKHLKDLTGKSPLSWTSAKMYLSNVLEPEGDVASSIPADEPQQIH